MLLGTGGLVVLCLLKTPLRWSGGVLVVIASVIAIRTPLAGCARFHRRVGTRGSGRRRTVIGPPNWPQRLCFRCDPSGCIVSLAGGKLVSQVITPDAFEEDCRLAAVVVTRRELPGECKALVVDRKVSRGHGDCASLER